MGGTSSVYFLLLLLFVFVFGDWRRSLCWYIKILRTTVRSYSTVTYRLRRKIRYFSRSDRRGVIYFS